MAGAKRVVVRVHNPSKRKGKRTKKKNGRKGLTPAQRWKRMRPTQRAAAVSRAMAQSCGLKPKRRAAKKSGKKGSRRRKNPEQGALNFDALVARHLGQGTLDDALRNVPVANRKQSIGNKSIQVLGGKGPASAGDAGVGVGNWWGPKSEKGPWFGGVPTSAIGPWFSGAPSQAKKRQSRTNKRGQSMAAKGKKRKSAKRRCHIVKGYSYSRNGQTIAVPMHASNPGLPVQMQAAGGALLGGGVGLGASYLADKFNLLTLRQRNWALVVGGLAGSALLLHRAPVAGLAGGAGMAAIGLTRVAVSMGLYPVAAPPVAGVYDGRGDGSMDGPYRALGPGGSVYDRVGGGSGISMVVND